jgi:hypothetical protein
MPPQVQPVSPDMLEYEMLLGGTGKSNQGLDMNAIYADALKEEKITNILSQINPDNLLADIEYRIRGYKKNTLSGEWEKINPKSKDISDVMVGNFMSFLGSVLNQNTSMSNFSSGEINTIMDHIIEYIADDLTVNDKKYGIVGNYQEMSRIGNIISMTVFSVLKRAQNGMEARRVFSALRIQETLTQAPQQKGLMDSMKFWK